MFYSSYIRNNINGKKIGYLMYNQFSSSFDGQLNAAFGEVSVRLFVIAKSFLLSLARLPQRG
jgi:hypothetical protein